MSSFIDEAIIRIQAGAGGNGCVSFRREKFVPRGGPDGGNGGNGGSIVMVATTNKTSLLDFKFRPIFKGKRGGHGKGKGMDGRWGEDLTIEVPLGTLIYDSQNGDELADLTKANIPFVVAEGGHGGKGNRMFTSSTQRAPRICTPGTPGVSRQLKVELRLLADVGLIGLPNAGKSSFLRAISKAHPKVADYAFTTLHPSLGVMAHKGHQIVVADLPGLIEGASHGTGLGDRFLKHVSRNRLLLHLVDFSHPVEDIIKNIKVIRQEVTQYKIVHLDQEQGLVFTKADLMDEAEKKQKLTELKSEGIKGFLISSHTKEGLTPLLDFLVEKAELWQNIEESPKEKPEESATVPSSP